MADLARESESPMSLTPPLSPVTQPPFLDMDPPGPAPAKQPVTEARDRDRGVHVFHCSQQHTGDWPQPGGWVQTGDLARLVGREQRRVHFLDTTSIQLFSQPYVPQFALPDYLEHLFYSAKMAISEIQQNKSTLARRKEIRFFLRYVADYIQSLKEGSSEPPVLQKEVMSQLQSLLLYQGRITEVAPALPTSPRLLQTGSGEFQHFHLYLDNLAAALEISHLHSTQVSVTGLENFGFHEAARVCLSELISLAAVTWQSRVDTGESLRCQPFLCPCVKELWLLLVLLANHRQEAMGEEPFWAKFQVCVDTACTKPKETELPDSDDLTPVGFLDDLPDSFGFRLWLLSHVAPLFGFDALGEPVSVSSRHGYYTLAQNWLTSALKQERVTEGRLRGWLGSCLRLTPVWGSNTHLLLLLWEHFTPRLNENFHLSGAGIDRFTLTSETPAALVDSCRKFSGIDDESLQREDSFSLFLRLLANHLSAIAKSGNLQEWKQIKGRFYSKFHPRRLQSLTETGLRQLTRLFLTLALSLDGADVAMRLCDLYRVLQDDGSCSKLGGRCAAVWRGHLALCHVLLDLGLDFLSVARTLASSFDSVCSEFSQLTSDPVRRHEAWRLLCLHLEGCQEVLDRAASLSPALLAMLGEGVGVGVLLPACHEGELRTVMTSLHSIVATLRSLIMKEPSHNLNCNEPGLLTVLWRSVYPAVRDLSMTASPPDFTGDMAADFALLALRSGSHSGNPGDDLSSLIQFFCTNVSVQIRVCCRLLTLLLGEEGVAASLVTQPGLECPLFQGWLRCVLLLPSRDSSLQDLNSLVLRLPFLASLWESQRLPRDPAAVYKTFLRALREHNNSLGLRERVALREKAGQWFAVVPATALPVVKALGPADTLTSLYGAVGRLVKHCAPLIYQESKADCLLPKLLDSMVVPHALFQTDRPLSPALLAVLRSHLHLFVLGLAQLDFGRSPYIQRQLKNIVIHYLPKFPLKSKETSMQTSHMVHPLLASVGESLGRSPTAEAVSFRTTVLSLVHSHFLQLRGFSLPAQATLGLSFITEVLRRTTSSAVVARDAEVLLMTMLEYVLLADSTPLKEHASRVVERLLEAGSKTDSTAGVETLRRFVEVYMATYCEGVLSTLQSLAPRHPTPLTPSSPSSLRSCWHWRRRGGREKTSSSGTGTSLCFNSWERQGRKKPESWMKVEGFHHLTSSNKPLP